MLRSKRCLQDLQDIMTIENSEPLTSDAVMDRYWSLIQQQRETAEAIEECRSVLTIMRKEGLINDKVEHPAFTLSWQTTKRWVYSPAVKELQGLEKVDGSATQTTSENWVARPVKPTL